MRTTELIERLSAEGAEPRAGAGMLLLSPVAAGCALSFVAMWAWLGPRPDLAHAMTTQAYWVKFAYTLALAAACFRFAERLGRPGASAARALGLLAIPLSGMALLAVVQLAATPQGTHEHLLLGASYRVCAWRIVALSLPIFVGTAVGLRRLAPTRLVAAGAAAGLLAGAAGAWVYAFHCDESAAPFIAIWYTLGVAAVGGAGGVLGRWLLRW